MFLVDNFLFDFCYNWLITCVSDSEGLLLFFIFSFFPRVKGTVSDSISKCILLDGLSVVNVDLYRVKDFVFFFFFEVLKIEPRSITRDQINYTFP